ncbi:MAG TPA: Na+/H+ antiporter NhaC family protein, partial [Candidatus Mediterraneibacter gallistercoris]|nr:Na+/H+ antiporter NhaC family protein [Candidatus Mediterraneibacter gallistercoris]
NHVSTQMQYAAVVAAVCLVGYVIAGIVHIWWVVLGISLLLLTGVLLVIRKMTGTKQAGRK